LATGSVRLIGAGLAATAVGSVRTATTTVCATTVASTATSPNKTLTRSHRTRNGGRPIDVRFAAWGVRPGGLAAIPHPASSVIICPHSWQHVVVANLSEHFASSRSQIDPVALWTSSAFIEDTRAWVAEQLAPRGIRLTGEWEQPHARVWSSTI
jgi:hypothetical protein